MWICGLQWKPGHATTIYRLPMEHFLALYRERYGRRVTGFEEAANAAMLGYDGPSNKTSAAKRLGATRAQQL